MKMDLAVAVVFLFGIFNLVGGWIGYVKAKSKASLIAGSLAGLVLLACTYGLRHGSPWAMLVSLVVSILLGGRFFGTWRKNHRFMPDLLMILLSLATIVAVGMKFLRS